MSYEIKGASLIAKLEGGMWSFNWWSKPFRNVWWLVDSTYTGLGGSSLVKDLHSANELFVGNLSNNVHMEFRMALEPSSCWVALGFFFKSFIVSHVASVNCTVTLGGGWMSCW